MSSSSAVPTTAYVTNVPATAYVTNESVLHRSIVRMAPATSLIGLTQALLGGAGINVATVGASVAQAGGCLTQPAKRCFQYRGVEKLWNPVPPHQGYVRIKGFLIRLFEEINSTWPSPEHQLYNGAADATPSVLLAECLFSHIPRRSHLVILEFGSMAKSCTLESVEAIVRALLDTPTPPAIVFLSVREWSHRRKGANRMLWGEHEATAWSEFEAYLLKICHRYEQTCLSYYEALGEPHG